MNTAILTAVIVAAASFILQKTLSNLIYGIIIFFTKPFKKGDKITIKHFNQELASGKLIKMGPLHIQVKDYNRDVAILPNSLLETCTIVNSDYKNGVNYINSIKVSFDSNIQKVEDIILTTVIGHKETENTLDNTHIINKVVDGGLSIEYNVRTADTDKSFDVCSDIAKDLVTTLTKEENVTLI